MNASIQASNIESAAPIQVLFRAGQFVRVLGGKTVGRVLEDTPDEKSATKVHIFDDDTWGASPSFGPGALTMWTPDEVRQVPTPKPAATPPLDLAKIEKLLMEVISAFELVEYLGKAEVDADNESSLPSSLKIIGSKFGDLAMDAVEMIWKEQARQEKAAKPRKKN